MTDEVEKILDDIEQIADIIYKDSFKIVPWILTKEQINILERHKEWIKK